jgi:spermidine synthase
VSAPAAAPAYLACGAWVALVPIVKEARLRFWTTICLTLAISAVGLTYEIAAGRVLAPYFGTSLLTWTAVIATVLAGFSLGSALGGLVAERDRRVALHNARTALLATAVLMALSPTILGLIHAMGAQGTGGMLVAVVVTFFPASVLITLPTPLLARLAVEARPGREGSSLGMVMAAGSLGAIAGAVLAGFVTLPLIGSTATFAACGAAALLCLPFLRDATPGGSGGPRGTRPGTGVVVATAGFTAFAGIAGGPACQYESGLSCLHVVRQGPEVLLLSDRTVQAAERAAPGTPGGAPGLALGYTQWIWSRMDRDLGAAPEVLFIGGGGYTLPTKLLADRAAARAVAVEIDPLVTRVVRRHMPAAREMIAATGHVADRDGPPEARLSIVHADGRVYLNETDRHFDAAVMDAFASHSVPAHLVTHETFARLRSIVRGPVYVNLIDTPDGPLARGVQAILTDLFDHVQAVQGPVTESGRANIVLAASMRDLAPIVAPEGYAAARISAARAFTDDRGWVGYR